MPKVHLLFVLLILSALAEGQGVSPPIGQRAPDFELTSITGQRVALSSFSGRAGPVDDTYAVYSTVLLHPVWDHSDASGLLLIAGTTGATYGGMDPEECIAAPGPYKERLKQAIAYYKARQSVKVQLRPDFRIPRPYRLLSEKESEEFVNLRFRGSAPTDARLAPLFKQTVDLIHLSQVFFDHDHTLAMVLVSNYCGGLCGGEKWRVLTKRNGIWVDENWAGCMTIS